MSDFVEVARQAFEFLERKYGFSVTEATNKRRSSHVTYVNAENGVAVKPSYDAASSFVFVFIYRLVDGHLRENSFPITDESKITCIDFNDVLPPNQKMKPAYEYGEGSIFYDEQHGLRSFVNEFAVRLEKFGGPLLRGDFH